MTLGGKYVTWYLSKWHTDLRNVSSNYTIVRWFESHKRRFGKCLTCDRFYCDGSYFHGSDFNNEEKTWK